MRRYRAPSIAPGTFIVAQSSADCTTSMSGFDFRQAQVEEPAFVCEILEATWISIISRRFSRCRHDNDALEAERYL